MSTATIAYVPSAHLYMVGGFATLREEAVRPTSLSSLSSSFSMLCKFIFSSTGAWLVALQCFVSDDAVVVAKDSVVASGYDTFVVSAYVADVGCW